MYEELNFSLSLLYSCIFPFFSTEAPKSILIQRVGDAGKDIIAAAGEDLELECIAQGSNPPSKLTWFASGKEIPNGHIQEDEKDSKGTYTSFSRLTLPVSKEDNRAEIKCKATHPALENPITAVKPLTIHCKFSSSIYLAKSSSSLCFQGHHSPKIGGRYLTFFFPTILQTLPVSKLRLLHWRIWKMKRIQ